MSAQKFYPHSAFVGLSAGVINFVTLLAQLQALALSAPVSTVVPHQSGGQIGALVLWDVNDFPDPDDDIPAVDAAIAAHTGVATSPLLQQFSSTAETTNANTTFIDKAASDFVSTPLDGGRWGLRFGALLRTTTTVVNSGVSAILRAGVGGSLSGADDRAYTAHNIFSATVPQLWTYFDVFLITSGQSLRFQPRFARNGAAVTAAMSEFRADLFRIGD